MQIVAPNKRSGLVRHTARLFGLSNRKGLESAAARREEFIAQADAEGDGDDFLSERAMSQFVPPPRKQRKDVLHFGLLALGLLYWEENTRPTANVRNTVKIIKDGKAYTHAVQWLECTVQQFYQDFLNQKEPPCSLYHEDEIRVRGLNQTVLANDLRLFFQRYGTIKSVRSHPKRGFAFVKFKTSNAAKKAVRAAGSTGSDLNINDDQTITYVTFRAKIGITKFCSVRPFYVKPVGRHTCVCVLCHGMRLIFKAFMEYTDWKLASKPMQELVDSTRAIPNGFSPTVDHLLQAILCPRDKDTGFFKLECCDGSCMHWKCGWNKRFGKETVIDNRLDGARAAEARAQKEAEEALEMADNDAVWKIISQHLVEEAKVAAT
jgi:hypothetical protein